MSSTTHFMSMVKVGPKGQIVIPKEIRDMFGITVGENLLIMADSERGIALHKQAVMQSFAEAIFAGQMPPGTREEPRENLQAFAENINKVKEEGESTCKS